MKNTGQHSEQLLVQELISGNEKAFRKLFDVYWKEVYAYSLSILRNEVFADEIVQDSFLQIWLKRETLDASRSIKPFLITVVKNKTLDFLKKAANDRKLREEVYYSRGKSHNPIYQKLREDDLEMVKDAALALLPPRRKLIFEMSRYEGKSYEEIGQELGITTNTVKSQMRKALETIRTFLLDNGDLAMAFLLIASEWA